MLDRIERRLLVIHIAVFCGVLSILALAVFGHFKHVLYAADRHELNTLADSVISSVDFDEAGKRDAGKRDAGKRDAGIPDTIANELQFRSAASLKGLRLQWFDAERRLAADKGRLIISVPFQGDGQFQEQPHPHALVLTKPALFNGKVLGYVRVAHPLEPTDELLKELLTGLVFGIIVSAAASAFGITLLIRQSMAPILEMIQRLKQFTADASHELGNPLMVIQSNSRVALKYPEGMRVSDKEKLEAIVDASSQMAQLTEALLLMARLDDKAGAPAGIAEQTDISALCRSEIQKQIGLHETSLAVKDELPDSLVYTADRADMILIFGNILGNAFQYTPAGGTITVKAKIENGNVMVSVQDTGIGISDEGLQHIFDRFWRADKARHHRNRGSGLGLSIVKAIVDKYKGTISVQSQLGAGSIFTIRLPVKLERKPGAKQGT